VGAILLAATAMSRLPKDALAQADEVECIKLKASDFAIKGERLRLPVEKLRGLKPDFPARPDGKVQAVLPGERLPVTLVDDSSDEIMIRDLPLGFKGYIYIFYRN
jgi:hypothetical protein